MKNRFLKTIAVAFPLSLIVVLGVKFATLSRMEHALDFHLDRDTRVLVLGNSHGRDAICDSLLPGWANRCSDGEMYWGVYLLAERMLRQNKIDTLVIPMTEFATYRDGRVTTEYLLYESSRMALADGELLARLWKINWRDLISFYAINDVQAMLKPAEVGGYEHWDHHGLKAELTDLDCRLARDGKVSTPRGSIADYTLQTHYLSRLIQLCQQKGVTLVMLNYPKYERGKYFDRSCAWDYYAIHGEGLRIADYEHFQLPDTSYYANSTHLNYRGAEYFSTSIRRHGLTLMQPKQWRRTRRD